MTTTPTTTDVSIEMLFGGTPHDWASRLLTRAQTQSAWHLDGDATLGIEDLGHRTQIDAYTAARALASPDARGAATISLFLTLAGNTTRWTFACLASSRQDATCVVGVTVYERDLLQLDSVWEGVYALHALCREFLMVDGTTWLRFGSEEDTPSLDGSTFLILPNEQVSRVPKMTREALLGSEPPRSAHLITIWLVRSPTNERQDLMCDRPQERRALWEHLKSI